ncbi:MAG: ABC transporter permease [Clostridiaceae bacterium]|nr:ABC transporter permease [Clostridiaceae bacterium]
MEKTKAKQSHFVVVLMRLKENRGAMIGMGIFLALVLIAVFAPLLTPYKYEVVDIVNANQFPSFAHPCGTDQLGRDILCRLIYGTRYSLQLGLWSTAISMGIGLLVGALAGFFGGAVDEVCMRLCDILQSIPGQVLNVAIACALGAGFVNCIIALSVSGIAGSARMIRASILSIRDMEYIQAASITNCSTGKIIMRHLLPNAIAPSIVQATMSVGGRITMAAGLAYLNLGVQSPTPEWGAMLAEGRTYIRSYPHMCIFPGILIIITVLSLNLFGDGLRDALDPKLKK